ncbi:type II secretion system protein [Nitrospirillum viridazoti]|uniref:General secretion pathway protein G n=1 Tax=Nitrospirillum amazonense TaxID=28077 RepID=A0A560IYB5_9PROT|nr:type II secretion system protein [Nitrospirillum amazonense]TWB64022.1 general secretion pathway protein G [Nitrospirillum amazonense]
MTGQRTSEAGFTLVELLVTLAIVGLLATLVLPVAQVATQRTQETELRRALRDIRAAIDAYHRASDDGRVAKEAGTTGYPPDLDVLVTGVEDQKDPEKHKIYFLRRVPRNPLASDPDRTDAATWAKRSYASEPDDPQEGDDVYDVYATSPRVGLNGVPYNKW